jgi:hypothetical protein
MAGECKPCQAGRAKKGFKYFSTEQQKKIAEARENGEEVNVTVAKAVKPKSSHPHKRLDR